MQSRHVSRPVSVDVPYALPPSVAANQGVVLIVDDDASLLSALTALVERAGYEVHAAASGAQGCNVLDQLEGRVTVVVSDVSMANGNGLELMRHAHRLDPELPVLLMTGVPSVETAVEALEAGAFKFLTKPVTPQALLESLAKAVSVRTGEADGASRTTSRTPASRARNELTALFDSALDQLWMAFQPLVDRVNQRVFAYEALVRSGEVRLQRPDLLFQAAETLGRVHELGRRIRAAVAREAALAPPDCKLFVNLHALDLDDPKLYSVEEPLGPFAARVVFEITERVSLSKLSDVESKIERLRRLGYAIAVDDLGAGYAALSSMAQLRPDVVKLDMSLVRNIDTDEMKQRLVAAVATLCSSMNVQMVAEGVETQAEYAALAELGANLLQGYLFARPQAGFASVSF